MLQRSRPMRGFLSNSNSFQLISQSILNPQEYARTEIKEILINLKRVEFINRVKQDLYNEASEDKDIIYYN